MNSFGQVLKNMSQPVIQSVSLNNVDDVVLRVLRMGPSILEVSYSKVSLQYGKHLIVVTELYNEIESEVMIDTDTTHYKISSNVADKVINYINGDNLGLESLEKELKIKEREAKLKRVLKNE